MHTSAGLHKQRDRKRKKNKQEHIKAQPSIYSCGCNFQLVIVTASSYLAFRLFVSYLTCWSIWQFCFVLSCILQTCSATVCPLRQKEKWWTGWVSYGLPIKAETKITYLVPLRHCFLEKQYYYIRMGGHPNSCSVVCITKAKVLACK